MALDLGKSLYTRLISTTEITTLVASSKICPGVLPQEEVMPAIIYLRLFESPGHASGQDIPLRNPTYQINCWSTSYLLTHSIAKAVKAELQDYTGALSTNAGVAVQRIFLENETEFSDVDPDTQETTFLISQDYIIWHTT